MADTSINSAGSGSDHYSGSDSSNESNLSAEDEHNVEWLEHVNADGSLFYVESYVSSTVKEKQLEQLTVRPFPEGKKTDTSSPVKLKKHNKLLGLLKRRPSLRVKETSRTGISDMFNSASTSAVACKASLLNSAPKVTFRDTPSGEIRYIALEVTGKELTYGRRGSLCELVLGIIPGKFNELSDSRVMVAGLVPGSDALQKGCIKIGDWLKEVEGLEVTWDNFEGLLGNIKIPGIVKVGVQKCATDLFHEKDERDAKMPVQTNLMKQLTGETPIGWDIDYKDLPHHVALYLSLEGITEESPDGSDVKYCFPDCSNKLYKLRGMFITIAHTVEEVTGTPAMCISAYEMVQLMEHLSQLIKFEFNLLSRAFCESKNRQHIDHMFRLTLTSLLVSQIPEGKTVKEQTLFPHPLAFLSSVVFSKPSWLVIRDSGNIKLQIDNCLNELEAGDFGSEDSDCEECRLLYTIVGSCIFYKGHLVSSHFAPDEVCNFWMFAQYHGLLALTHHEAVSQLVVWQECYPAEIRNMILPSSLVRHYILFVGMNHMLIGLLLESGYATEIVEFSFRPDPFLIDQVEATLYQMHSFHVHSICEESRKKNAFSKKKEIKDGISNVHLPDVPSILKQRSYESQVPSYSVNTSDCSCEASHGSDDSCTHSFHDSPLLLDGDEESEDFDDQREDISENSDWRIWKGSGGYFYQDPELLSNQQKIAFNPVRVTCGSHEVLFHGIHMENGDGVLIETFSKAETFPCKSSLNMDLLKSFQAAASHIHSVLHRHDQTKTFNSNISTATSLSPVKEFGIMFNYTAHSPSKKKDIAFSYWVVGRILGAPHAKEIYVCFEDSIPQSIIDMAFKFSFGYGI